MRKRMLSNSPTIMEWASDRPEPEPGALPSCPVVFPLLALPPNLTKYKQRGCRRPWDVCARRGRARHNSHSFFLRLKEGSVEEEFQQLQRSMWNIVQQFSPVPFHELLLACEFIFLIYFSSLPSQTQHPIPIHIPIRITITCPWIATGTSYLASLLQPILLTRAKDIF